MSRISREEAAKIALLARLELTAEELDLFTGQLGDILQYMEKLTEADVEGVEPFINAAAGGNVWREDRPGESLPREAALANAPREEDGFFRVPRVT